MHQEVRDEMRIRLALAVLEYAHHFGVAETCCDCNRLREGGEWGIISSQNCCSYS